MEKNFSFFAIEDRSQDIIFDCPLHYPLFKLVIQDATFHLLMLVNITMFFHFYFVLRHFYFSFLIIVRVLSLPLVAIICSSVSCYPICHFDDCTFFKYVSFPKLTVSYSFNRLSIVKLVSAFNS